MYFKVMFLTLFSLSALELSNSDPNNNVFACVFTWPRCHKASLISLSSHVFSFSQDATCPMVTLVSQLGPWFPKWPFPLISINTWESTTAGPVPSTLVLPDSLHDQSPPSWGWQTYFIAEPVTFDQTNRGAPPVRIQQLLHQSHLAQSRTGCLGVWNQERGGKIFC